MAKEVMRTVYDSNHLAPDLTEVKSCTNTVIA